MADYLPFNRPFLTGKELENIEDAYLKGHLSGDGAYTKKCHTWLEQRIGSKKALLTHSCTAALEMAALLIDAQPGDEIIMPSYTFVSTANAFVLRGATPVFIDIRDDTLNLDETLIEAAITDKTKAIVPVHYAGVGCEMQTIMEIASRHKLFVIEDAAQGILAGIDQKPLGSFGHFSALSFHETKNIISGEGGALLVNDSEFVELAEIIREKGTNRQQFADGKVDKYTWHHLGSSYLPSEIIAAFLHAQLEQAEQINQQRINAWRYYHATLQTLESQGKLRSPIIPHNCQHNAHLYYILVESAEVRSKLLEHLKQNDILGVFHYIPLHSSPAGQKYCRAIGDMKVTNDASSRIIRLPLWPGIKTEEQDRVLNSIREFFT